MDHCVAFHYFNAIPFMKFQQAMVKTAAWRVLISQIDIMYTTTHTGRECRFQRLSRRVCVSLFGSYSPVLKI